MTTFGFAVTAGTLVAVGSMVHGLEAVFALDPAAPPRYAIHRLGAPTESGSVLLGDEVYVGIDMDEAQIRSPELVMLLADHPLTYRETTGAMLVRGVTDQAFILRPDVRIVRGRMFSPGKNEAIIGVGATRTFHDLAVGSTLTHHEFERIEWEIVGHFDADGKSYESEAWVNLTTAQQLYRGGANAISVVWIQPRLRTVMSDFEEKVVGDPRYRVDMRSEREMLAARAGPAINRLRTFLYWTALVFIAGAIVVAASSAFALTAQCMANLHSLHTIGFGVITLGGLVAITVAVLSSLGSAIGVLAVDQLLDGIASSTADGNLLQTSFRFAVGPASAGGIIGTIAATALGSLLAGPFAVRRTLSSATRVRRVARV